MSVDIEIIKRCAGLCKESYGSKTIDYTDIGDLRYGIKRIDGTIYVIFRGTDNFENFLRDADVIPSRSCSGYLAHAGFVDSYRKICSSGLQKALAGVSGHIVATGHSLGGAIATLLAEQIGCDLVTFGSPRVYFRFGKSPVLKHTRLIGDDDPVPMVPKIMYHHVNNPVTLVDGDSSIIEVKDHSIDVYISKLGQLEAFNALHNG